MKKLNLFMVMLLAVAITSCRQHRHVTIVTQTNNNYIKLEYTGQVMVDSVHSRIESIPTGCYVNFKHNNNELYAAAGTDGKIQYELNGDKVNQADNTTRQLLAEAVKMIAKSQGRH